MADFLTAYTPLKAFEGGWCHVSGDAGGETYAGIARVFFPWWPGWPRIDASKNHPAFREGPAAFSRHLATLPGLDDLVTDWYRAEWWDKLGLHKFPQAVASEIFEQAVNLGKGGAGRLVQRLCNGLNYHPRTGQALFADISEDGAIGPKTLAALHTVITSRASVDIVHALNCLQGAHYINLAAQKPTQRQFLAGWLTRTKSEE